MLEIGVFRGSSTKVWEDFFQGGQEEFYGLGYGTDYFAKGQQDSKVKYGEKTTLYYGDQSDQNVLKYLVQDIGQGLDVIIDDGSHDPEDQILGFNMLFPLLNDGGGEEREGERRGGLLEHASNSHRFCEQYISLRTSR